jgi:polynucleotide 5'-kinase involved in rRNA processing
MVKRNWKNNNNSRRLERSENGQKNWLRRFKNTRIENFTIDTWMMRALLEKKIQFEEKSTKLDVYGLN